MASCQPRAVRDLLEELDSGPVDSGLRTAIFNKRGVYAKNPTAGGTSERDLASRNRQQAADSSEWPHMRRIFRDLADTYERHALQEDERAERRRRGLPG